MELLNTLVQLFLSFMRIGFTSFGGMSMIPLILEEMTSHNWMTPSDVSNIVAIAEMTPGSLGVNCATFAGTKTAGVLGGCAAVLGVLSPTLTLTLAASIFFQKFRDSKVMTYIMSFVKPICIGMILNVLLSLSLETFASTSGGVDFAAIALGIGCFVLIRRFKWSVPAVIGAAAAAGLVLFGVPGVLLG